MVATDESNWARTAELLRRHAAPVRPLVSVVIPTVGREALLVATTEAVLRQTYGPLEVLIVDQANTAFHALDGAGLIADARVKVLSLPVANLHLARNTGLHYAQGDLILLLDDDVTFDVTLVQEHVAGHSEPDVGAVVGRIDEEGEPSIEDADQMPRFGAVSISGRCTRYRGGVDYPAIAGTLGSNVSFKRTAIASIGAYDLRFDAVNSFYDDLDVGYRLRRAGFRLVFRQAARMVHLKVPYGGGRLRRPSAIDTQVSRFRNVTFFYLKNMNPLGIPCFLAVFVAIAVKHWMTARGDPAVFLRLLRAISEGYQMRRSRFAGCAECRTPFCSARADIRSPSGVPYCELATFDSMGRSGHS